MKDQWHRTFGANLLQLSIAAGGIVGGLSQLVLFDYASQSAIGQVYSVAVTAGWSVVYLLGSIFMFIGILTKMRYLEMGGIILILASLALNIAAIIVFRGISAYPTLIQLGAVFVGMLGLLIVRVHGGWTALTYPEKGERVLKVNQ